MKRKQSTKPNFLIIIAGLLMLTASLVNYSLNNDFISLGIFVFAGLGFIMLGAADAFDSQKRKRIKRLAYMFFTVSLLILGYWFFHAKLEIL